MILVLGLAGLIWWGGRLVGFSRPMRMALLALLYAAVLLIQLTLPEGSPLREATGGSASLWLILGGVGVIVALYTAVLKRLRERVEANDNTPEMQKSEAPFRDVELDRYARHIVLREVGGLGQKRLKDAKVLVIGAGGWAHRRFSISRQRVSAPSG